MNCPSNPRGVSRSPRSVNAPRAGEHHEIEERGELFVKIPDGVMRRDGQHAATRRLKFRQHTPQTARLEPSVGVEEQQQIARRRLRALVASPRLAPPAIGERLRMDDARPVFTRHFRRAIRGGVVHDDDFVRTDGLCGKRAEQGWQVLLLVAGGDDEGKLPGAGEGICFTAAAKSDPAKHNPACKPKRERDDEQSGHLSQATTFLATFWPQSTTIGIPPPGFTEPPTKNRFG
jgi:hypothetical protein